MKRIVAILLAVLLFVCACGLADVASPVNGKRTAYIINMARSDIFEQCAKSCVETAETLGMTCDVFFSDGDDQAFCDRVRDCAANGYDGLYLSHGGERYSYSLLTELTAEYPELRVVTFDTQFTDDSGNPRTIEGVTQFFQDDAGLAEKPAGIRVRGTRAGSQSRADTEGMGWRLHRRV